MSIDKRLRDGAQISESGCWIWPGYSNRGYVRIRSGSRRLYVHRLAYETFVGPIPEGMTVDHLCFVSQCVNPEHLRLLTMVENAANQRSAQQTHCKNGHEFTFENTYRRPASAGGGRQCRPCNRQSAARYQAKKRAA